MPSDLEKPITIVDGSSDWSGGVNSLKVNTIQSAQNPNGLARNELAWLINGTVRGGGIAPRNGWNFLLEIASGAETWQGGYMYEPDYNYPYLIIVLSGHVYKVDPMSGMFVDLSLLFNVFCRPGNLCHFCQAEKWLVIQSGDYGQGGAVIPGLTDSSGNYLPLFWDDTTLRRSVGITDTALANQVNGVNEIPAATCMDYYMNRLWYAQGRTYSAGDIVSGPSGTAGNDNRDSVLNVTENPLVLAGDGFTVPTNAGNIRALKHSANLDSTLGQSLLFIFTRHDVYSLDVPVSRAAWIAADTSNMPVQKVVQITNGAVNDKSVIAINGDLFYQSLEPSIRSLFMAIRYFNQWANVPISSNIYRLLRYNDRALMYAASGAVFDNRLLMTSLPIVTPQGVVHPGLAPLDFTPLTTLNQQLPPVWEGVWEGLDHYQLFTGDFGGRERCFSVVRSRENQAFQLWEFTDSDRFNNIDTRTTVIIEFPSFTFGNAFQLKRLAAAELMLDKILGEVIFKMEYRPDNDVCWHFWHEWKICTQRNSCDDMDHPICYPVTEYRESFRSTLKLPMPPLECQSVSNRPVNVGYQFQPKLTVKGWFRVRGLLLHAEPMMEPFYDNLVC